MNVILHVVIPSVGGEAQYVLGGRFHLLIPRDITLVEVVIIRRLVGYITVRLEYLLVDLVRVGVSVVVSDPV